MKILLLIALLLPATGRAAESCGFWGWLKGAFRTPANEKRLKWLKTAFIKQEGLYFFNFGTVANPRWVRVMRWSESGNPIIRVPARGTRFIERQSGLPSLDHYGGASARGADIERVNAEQPVFGAYIADENGGAIELADGYHRRYYAEKADQNLYVELEAAEDLTQSRPH